MKISKIFAELFNTDKNSNYAKLKKIKKEIKNISPRYYNPYKAVVYGTFAYDLYSFYQSCLYFEKPLNHLFLNKKALETTLKYIISLYVPKEIMSYILMMEKEKVDEVIEKFGQEKTEKYYKKMISYILSYLKPSTINTIDKDISRIKQLYELTTFNYVDIFSIFNLAFTTTQNKKNLSFNDIRVSLRFINSFEDFTFLISNVSLEDSVLNPLLIYLKKYAEIDPSFVFDNGRIKKEFSRINKMLTDKFSYLKFEMFLKSMKENPDFQIKIIPHSETYVSAFVNDKIKIVEDYISTLKVNEIEKNYKLIIKSIFNEIPLIKSDIYNEEVSTHFSANLLPSFSKVKPFEIFRTFLVNFWEGKIKETLSDFIFHANYADEEFKIILNDTFHIGSEFIDRINDFESNLEDLRKFHIIIIKKPDTIVKSSSQKSNIITCIMNANRNAESLLIDGFNFLDKLEYILYTIILSIQKKDQSRITNLLSLINTDLYKQYRSFYDKVKSLKPLIRADKI